MKNKKAYFIVWIVTFIASCLFIYYGNQYVSEDLHLFESYDEKAIKGVVTGIIDTYEEESFGYDGNDTSVTVLFTCRLLEGKHKGEVVDATQMIEPSQKNHLKIVEPQDKILLYRFAYDDEATWHFTNYIRSNQVIVLALVFLALVLLIGRTKGVNTIVSLAMTCMSVFLIFVPSVLNGYNVYLSSIIICSFTIISTLLFVNGICKKSIATMIGCIAGVIIAAVSTGIMSKVLNLTGMVDEESYYLTLIESKNPIDIKAIVFGCIIIGALGAIMDIAMDIASSLYEIKKHARDITFTSMLRSGMEIGRDVIGTMSNTLVLAYIGSSLSSILLLMTYSSSLFELINKEVVIVDLLQAFIGSLAILLTIPITAFVCALLYTSGYTGDYDKKEDSSNDFDVFWN